VENTTDFQNYKVTVFGGNANALTKEDSTFIKIHNIQLINLNSIRRINSKY
jgi:DNA-binding LytR/AlgR family response regulator